MKIIKATKQVTEKEMTCQRCRSELLVAGSDLKFHHDPRDGAACSYTCPVCQHSNWVSISLLPQAMVDQAKR